MCSLSPVLCIGQTSTDLALALQRLNKRLDFPPLRLLWISNDEPSPTSQNYNEKFVESNIIIHCKVPRCSHDWLAPQQSCDVCMTKTRCIFEACPRFLDTFDSFREVVLFCEIQSSFALYCLDQVLSAFQLYEIHCPLHTILLKPPHPPSGVENIFCVCIAAKALEHSSMVMIRGVGEYLVQIEEDRATSTPLDLDDCCHMMACDLWVMLVENNGALFDRSQYSLWPEVFTTSRCKLIDVRSSLCRTLTVLDRRKKRGGESDVDLKPTRLLCSNLHELHHSYANGFPAILTQNAKISNFNNNNLASCVGMLVDCPAKQNLFVPLSTVSPHGCISPMLSWATKSISWTVLEESEMFPPLKQLKEKSDENKNCPITQRIPIAVLVLESVYAKLDLLNFFEKSKSILCNGAYSHFFGEEKYLSFSIVSDAMTIVENHLLG